MRASVVIPTLDRAGDLGRCLDALSRQTLPRREFEIIVADGGSSDNTKEAVEGCRMENLSFLLERKRGAAAGRNAGIRKASGRFIAFTDDDCVPGPTWLADLLAGFPDEGGCAGVGGTVSPLKDCVVSRYIDHSRVGRNIRFGGKAIHLPTTNAMYSRAVLEEVGLFDDRIIICEDIELSQKVLRKGYYLKALDGAPVLHKDPTDIRTLYRKSFLHGTGVATVERLSGRKRKMRNLLLELLFPGSFMDKYADGKPHFADSLAFSFLRRVQIAGVHQGYISSR